VLALTRKNRFLELTEFIWRNAMTISKEAPVPRAFDTIVWGGLLAGTLDAVDGFAIAWYAHRSATPR
jgi:hypothetical protein